jgi:hypothetical protein
LIAAAAAFSAIVYATTWANGERQQLRLWPFFLCVAATFVSGSVSAHVLKPHYRVGSRLHIPKLKPFLTPTEYKSIWAAFVISATAFFIGALQLAAGGEIAPIALQMFAAGTFSALYTDAVILLRAKLPNQSVASGEA